MALTPDSSTSAYITPAEFLQRYDSNLVAQLISDTGSQVSQADLPTNANLLAILADASGMLEQSVLIGGRYTPNDLNTLINPSSGFVGGSLVKRIVADLAIGLLRNRRGMSVESFPAYLEAQGMLELLRRGQLIFPFKEAEQAGQASDVRLTYRDFLKQGRVSTWYQRFFGNRIDDYTNWF